MRNKEFFKSSQEIVKNFLNSVVAVDDQLCFGKIIETPTDHVHDDFDAPVDDSGLGVLSVPQEADISTPKITHQLDYQDLSISFSEHGINCCGFIPDVARFPTIDVAAESIMKSSKRADITILDWSMDSTFAGAGKGTLAIESIKKIIQHDRSQHGRLRLIVIYTAEADLEQIAENIKEQLNSINGNNFLASRNNLNIVFGTEDLEFCQISIIEKQAKAEALRNEVIALFTELTIGLLSNATLSSIGELRDKTHHILHSFNKDLDPAYLSHVIGLLSSPKVRENADEVAFDYAAELISEEFKSIIQVTPSLKLSLDKNRVKDWLEHINPSNENDFFEIMVGEKTCRVGTEKIKSLLDATTTKLIKDVLSSPPAIIELEEGLDAHSFFERNRIQVNLSSGDKKSHEKLSIIECKRRDGLSISSQAYLPNIKQGSIVKDKNSNYYICLQPLCDSVRLSGDTGFLFLKVDEITKPQGKFSHVIRSQNGQQIKLMVRASSVNLHKFIMKYDSTSRTIKTMRNELEGKIEYVVQHQNQNGDYENLTWIGELKNNVTQAISHSVASNISRIGVDTNEWLRLSSSVH